MTPKQPSRNTLSGTGRFWSSKAWLAPASCDAELILATGELFIRPESGAFAKAKKIEFERKNRRAKAGHRFYVLAWPIGKPGEQN